MVRELGLWIDARTIGIQRLGECERGVNVDIGRMGPEDELRTVGTEMQNAGERELSCSQRCRSPIALFWAEMPFSAQTLSGNNNHLTRPIELEEKRSD